jgi:hypothetical protein
MRLLLSRTDGFAEGFRIRKLAVSSCHLFKANHQGIGT